MRTAIEIGQQGLAAAVAHFQHANTCGLAGILRLQHHEICLGIDQAFHVVGRFIEIDDLSVCRVCRIERKGHDAFEFFVSADAAEFFTLQYRRARFDLDIDDGCVIRTDVENEKHGKTEPDAEASERVMNIQFICDHFDRM